MKAQLLSTLLLITSVLLAGAQTTITLKPSSIDGKDGHLRSLSPNTNHGTYPEIAAQAWTNGGDEVNLRGLFDFDWNQIPTGATVTDAKLFLYFNSNNSTTGPQSGDNASWLERVITPWEEFTVTWNTQPSTTQVNRILLPTSTAPSQNYTNIDVTSLVRDILSDTSNSYGFMLRLDNETAHRRMQFASSDNTNSALHPKIEITYVLSSTDTCITFKPGAIEGKDGHLRSLSPNTNHGTYPEIAAQAWTNAGDEVNLRGLLDFNWSQIPTGAIINDARLFLYFNSNNSTTGPQSGENASWLERVVTPWDEHTVTWNSQPVTTEVNSVLLPTSTFPSQNYTNINVTALVKDILNDTANSHGFMLRLDNESAFRRMQFASSDNTNSSLHPKLEVCYSLPTGIRDKRHQEHISVFPNPFKDLFHVVLPEIGNFVEKRLVIYDLLGNVVFQETLSHDNSTIQVNLGALADGQYLMKITTDDNTYTQHLIKIH